MLLAEVSQHLGAIVKGDDSIEITGVNTLAQAKPDQISFFNNTKFTQQLLSTNAAAVIISDKYHQQNPATSLIVTNPHLAYAQTTALFADKLLHTGIDKTASVSKEASLAANVTVGKNVIINSAVKIGSGSFIGDNCVLGQNTVIGENCILHPNTTLYGNTKVGDKVIIHASSVIGADGFGFARDQNIWHKIHHLGGVIIGNNVEIGAGVTIDRASLDNTIISDGVKLDDQVHIGHNAYIGENTIIAGTSVIGGSSVIGKNCTIGGACGIIDNITITDNVTISGMSRVDSSIHKPGRYTAGTWIQEHYSWKRTIANLLKFNKINSNNIKKNDRTDKSPDGDGYK